MKVAAGAVLAGMLATGATASRLLREKDAKGSAGEPVPDGLMTSYLQLRNSGQHTCGATVLEGGWVISAAHCFYDMDRSARSGNSYLSFVLHTDGEQREVIQPASDLEIYIPTEYHPWMMSEKEMFYGDVAMFHVPELGNRRDIVYPRLPTSREEADDATMLITVGVGMTETGYRAERLEFMSVLREGAVGETPAFSDDYPIESDHFVAKDSGGEDQDACRGDSGGGIYIPSRHWPSLTEDPELDERAGLLGNDDDILVGLVSWGPTECGEEGAYTVRMRSHQVCLLVLTLSLVWCARSCPGLHGHFVLGRLDPGCHGPARSRSGRVAPERRRDQSRSDRLHTRPIPVRSGRSDRSRFDLLRYII